MSINLLPQPAWDAVVSGLLEPGARQQGDGGAHGAGQQHHAPLHHPPHILDTGGSRVCECWSCPRLTCMILSLARFLGSLSGLSSCVRRRAVRLPVPPPEMYRDLTLLLTPITSISRMSITTLPVSGQWYKGRYIVYPKYLLTGRHGIIF